MASSSTHHTQAYQKAVAAYVQGHYDEAARITDDLVSIRPEDPNLRLLRGHIHCCQQQYKEAHAQYQAVLGYTSDPELIALANESIAKIREFIAVEPAPANGGHDRSADSSATSLQGDHTTLQADSTTLQGTAPEAPAVPSTEDQEIPLENFDNFGVNEDSSPFDAPDIPSIENEYPLGAQMPSFNPFDEDAAPSSDEDPFALPPLAEPQPSATLEEFSTAEDIPEIPIGESVQPLEAPAVDEDDITMLMGSSPLGKDVTPANESPALAAADNDEALFDWATPAATPPLNESVPSSAESPVSPTTEEALFPDFEFAAPIPAQEEASAAAASDLPASNSEVNLPREATPQAPSRATSEEDELFADFTGSDFEERVGESPAPKDFDPVNPVQFEDSDEQTIAMRQFPTAEAAALEDDATMAMASMPPIPHGEAGMGEETIAISQQTSFDPNTLGGASASEGPSNDLGGDTSTTSGLDFEEEMTIACPQPQVNLASSQPQTDWGTETFAVLPEEFDPSQGSSVNDLAEFSLGQNKPAAPLGQGDSHDGTHELSVFAQPAPPPSPSVAAPLSESAPVGTSPPRATTGGSFTQQNLTSAVTTGLLSALVAGATVGVGLRAPAPVPFIGGTAAGVTAGLTAYLMGQRSISRIKRFCSDLQAQCNAVIGGDMTAHIPVSGNDELGVLAQSFNQMTDTLRQITADAQKKAEENERQRDDLQRQVIRLLDDVEGAARGDLTVQAEVTADVLGAVADSFNLTIHNLRTIVQQVKVAAQQVSRGAAENETFARSLSADALRQAEELAVTLNSVQMMTNAIQRVAESAQEASAVARRASETALRGGEAVERTVAGILQIRETVAETTRKVKRLAESSQEIAKIVSVISSIANRTNLLALNASIEAARAGESGRGFAVVADEVRQLADRAAKASKEIEQIVLQIQSETGAVMTAMEEGTQQVIEGTKRAEQAKRSLEDIIQVSSQIDALVQSITNATVEQTESARSMAQVMQSIELTAQATSQEAQRVSDSLQGLVSVARNLQASVERFRVESTEDQI